ncbi:unnamed protein product [Victoria cruziana]
MAAFFQKIGSCFSGRSEARRLIEVSVGIQVAALCAVLPVCFAENLPYGALRVLLIIVICLLISAFCLTSSYLLYSYFKIQSDRNSCRRKAVIIISVVIAITGVVIFAVTGITRLIPIRPKVGARCHPSRKVHCHN